LLAVNRTSLARLSTICFPWCTSARLTTAHAVQLTVLKAMAACFPDRAALGLERPRRSIAGAGGPRQFHRVKVRFAAEGVDGLIHRLRGRASPAPPHPRPAPHRPAAAPLRPEHRALADGPR
jgi:hypothetical protein